MTQIVSHIKCLFDRVNIFERAGMALDAENLLRQAVVSTEGISDQQKRQVWIVLARLGANLALQSCWEEASRITHLALRPLRAAVKSTTCSNDLVAALATAETTSGLCAQQSNSDALAVDHFRRAMKMYDLVRSPDPEDAVFVALQLLISSGFESDLDPLAVYMWVQPYLETLPLEHKAAGAQVVMWLGHFADFGGQNEFARRRYIEAIAMVGAAAAVDGNDLGRSTADSSDMRSLAAEVLRESVVALMQTLSSASVGN